MNLHTVRAAALCLAGLALTSRALAAGPNLPGEGWASWPVDAVEDSPDWCCGSSWGDSRDRRETCDLDGQRQGSGRRDHATTDAVRLYAHVTGGKVDRVRALSASCPVKTKTPIQELAVANDDSARWLAGLAQAARTGLEKHDHDIDDVLAALGMHRGAVALNALSAMAREDSSIEMRKKSVFWLANLRGAAGAEVVSSAMFNDRDPELRKHAAFAMSISKSARAADDLIRLGKSDKDGDVRAQAWFWLAHTGAPNAESAIGVALRQDADDQVRKQAIFALSQLPDERATRALIAAAQDKTLPNEQRKRAVFWLAQSDSPGASSFLEKVLLDQRGN